MKVQLNTNYTNRNLNQSNKKTQAFANPNFKSTFLVSTQNNGSWLLMEGMRIIMESLNPTAIRNVETKGNPFTNHLLASFDGKKDSEVANVLKLALKGETGVRLSRASEHALPQKYLNEHGMHDLPFIQVLGK